MRDELAVKEFAGYLGARLVDIARWPNDPMAVGEVVDSMFARDQQLAHCLIAVTVLIEAVGLGETVPGDAN